MSLYTQDRAEGPLYPELSRSSKYASSGDVFCLVDFARTLRLLAEV